MKNQFAARNLVLAFCVSLAVVITAPSLHAASPVSMRVIRDMSYVTGPGADPRFHTIDLYLPEGKTNFPLVLFVHGGGLTQGDKTGEGFLNFVDLFLREGIGVASCNYRLSPAVKHPAHIQDVAKAFAWVYQNSGQYQIDRNRIFIAGHSSGGSLVALLALDRQYLAAEGLSPQAIRGVMSMSGIYDRANGSSLGSSRADTEPTYGTTDPSVLRLASPAYYVGQDKQVPPFLITYTDRDLYGMAEQGRRFYSLFLRHDLPVELAVTTDRTHYNEIGGVGQRLPRVDEPGTRPGVRTILSDDTLGPALLRFVDGVLRGLPMATVFLKSATPSVRTVKDIPYYKGPGADPGVDSKFHSMDLYLPEGKTNFPMVFFIHGGGWRAGDKGDPGFKSFVGTFAKIGIGVASANYRLSPAVKHPAHIQDVAKAFAWLHENASQYGIDRNRLFVAGQSAGGHLAALLALNAEYLRKEGLSPSSIKGVLSLNGVYDMANLGEIGVIPSRREQAFSIDPKVLEEVSPIRYVSRQAPPFLIVYAENDLFSIREEAQTFYAAMLRQGAKAQLAHIPGRTHFSTLSGMGQQLDQVDDVMAPTAVEFVTRLLASSDGTSAP